MLIDLDAPVPERPGGSGKRRPLVVVALLLAVAEVVGGATPARADGLVVVADTGGMAATASLLTEDALVAAHPGNSRETLIRAWPLRPGGPRWSTSVDAANPRLFGSGTAIVADPGPGRPGADPRRPGVNPRRAGINPGRRAVNAGRAGVDRARHGALTVLDARTGRVRWHAPPDAPTVVAGDRVAFWSAADGRLRLADLATGRILWSRPATLTTLAADSGHLVAVGEDGQGTAYGMADGRVLATGREFGAGQQSFAVVGGRLYKYGTGAVTAFSATDLTPLWRAEIGVALVVRDCGAVVCVAGPASLAGLDPRTGRVRWADRRWRDITAAGIVSGDAGRTLSIDPATGRVLRELGRGGVVGDLMLRLDAGRTWVTALADGRVFGALPPVSPADCSAAGAYLGCSTTGQVIKVWRLRR